MKFFIKSVFATILVSTSSIVLADEPTACQLIDVQVNSIQLLDDSSNVVTIPDQNATNCLGAFTGNNSAFDKPVQNLGYDDDGWLNKEDYNNWWEGPGAFVDEADLIDLDGDGYADDPGWVLVGKEESTGFEGASSTDGITTYNHEQLVSLTNCKTAAGLYTSCFGGEAVKGDWVYTPPAQNPKALTNLIGGDFFDQVAIVFKAGNTFAMYNFNMVDFGLDPTLAGDYNFAFTGTWDISDTLESGLSNLSFWARDPIHNVQVPEPSTLVLLIMSGLFFFSKRRKV